jgi:glycosyltransferase involved in cell wall biosynthesis
MQIQFQLNCSLSINLAPSMRIAVNTRFLLKGKLEGIGWFTYETIKRMVMEHPEHEFIFLFDRPYSSEYIFANNITPVIVQPPARHALLFYIWFEWRIPALLKQYNADVFVSTDGFCSLSTKVPQVLVIHDLAFLKNKNYLGKLNRWYLTYFTPKWVAKAKAVVGVSQYTINDIHNTYKVNNNKLHLVYNGANEVYQPLSFEQRMAIKQQYTQGYDYFAYAGSLHPRKNIVRLLEAFALFKRNTRNNMKLVLVGRLAWRTEAIQQALEAHPYKQDIIRFEYMEAAELSQIIGAAYALTYVSEFEGFGIPILEALRCHVPAISGNTSSMPEVGGNACLYANPFDAIDIADKIMEMYNNEPLRNKLKHNCIAQAQLFSWQKSSNELYKVITQVANQ